jgi:hypothetical protein
MKCLIDADLLLWECSYAGQVKDEETGELMMLDFDNVKEVFDQRIKEIEDECWANEPSVLYFTGDEKLVKTINKEKKREGRELLAFKPNFRLGVASSTPYKNRKSTRPLHYYNLRAYALNSYDCKVLVGMEADDGLAMDQDVEGLTTIICSRDKDLRQVPGMFYSWECGLQPAFGPTQIDVIGTLDLPRPNKLVGTGLKFFYAQMIMGDSVDTIPGLRRGGPSLAYKTLAECETEEELYGATKALYESRMGEDWEDYFKEQAALLWMVRELDEEGEPVPYCPPDLQL